MSQENVDTAHRLADAFNRRDFDVLSGISHEDLVFTSALAAVEGAGGTYRGAGLWPTYFEVMDGAWEDWQVVDVTVVDAGGDRLASTFRLVGTGRSSGARVQHEIGLAYEFREGKVWRLRSYLDPAEALKAVGLSE